MAAAAARLAVSPSFRSSFSRIYVAASLAIASVAMTPVVFAAPADDGSGAPVEVESAKNSFPGIVNSNAVYVRSGPAESYYPTLKLDKGARVTVVGMKLDWLKIVPPEGSFCYISKAFVDRSGDGSVGKVNKDSVNVRAGSVLNSLKVVPLTQLSMGMEVKILGEQDEYFKIAPPEGKAFVYINKQFVDPDPEAKPKPIEPTKAPAAAAGPVVAQNDGGGAKPVGPIVPPVAPQAQQDNGGGAAAGVGAGPIVTTNPDKMQPKEKTVEASEPVANEGASVPATAGATTKPAGDGAVAAAPTTKPAEDAATVEAQFEKAEIAYAAAEKLPVDQQPIAELTKRYEALVASDTLTNTLHRIAETRLATLKVHADAAAKLAAAKTAQDEIRKRQQALVAERQELEQRLQNAGVSIYTAVGELQASSLQLGSKTLYRLTDPANGRTVCYLRSDDGKLVSYMGKFIGVKGALTTEPQLSLKVVTPTDVAAVEPSKVNHGVTATVIPPSMVGNGQEASTAGNVQQP